MRDKKTETDFLAAAFHLTLCTLFIFNDLSLIKHISTRIITSTEDMKRKNDAIFFIVGEEKTKTKS